MNRQLAAMHRSLRRQLFTLGLTCINIATSWNCFAYPGASQQIRWFRLKPQSAWGFI